MAIELTKRAGAEDQDFLGATGGNANNLPKVVLLDLTLPKVDGQEVLRAIRSDEQTRLIPLVVMTSSREERDVIQSYKLGVISYVVKPMNFDDFSAAIAQLGHRWLLVNQESK
jgi:two-component system, response regulator